MFTHTKLKDVDTIISQCVRSRTNDGNYLKSFWQSMQKTGREVKKKKKRKAIAELIAFHANAIIVKIITVTVVILMMLL